jgi:hypothetical protein
MKVDANPTKEFFISMLTRDIALDRAILDLIDNSVDAAIASGSVIGKCIDIKINSSLFEISDNCGGFDIETAQKYAFRFGRDPKEHRVTPNSVGQFGVGMKRTLFKLGNNFTVKSVFDGGAFELTVDVNEWLHNDSHEWEFSLNELTKDPQTPNGTYISVTSLKPSVAEQFEDNEFLRNFKKEVAEAHFKSINKGLNIKINGQSTSDFDIKVRFSEELGAVVLSEIFDGVKVTVRAGVDEQNISLGGWYIVCNGRLVESAEQTKKTLWGTTTIPKYHDRFAFFRGVVEFECVDSSKLPWTTTKTGVDTDHPAYRFANKLMCEALVPIISFLNQREAERKQYEEGRLEVKILNQAIDCAQSKSIYSLSDNILNFVRPEKLNAIPPTFASITYQIDVDKLNIAKERLGASNNKEVGELTFNYYFSYECE